jgi:hypothetical protein
VNKLPVLTEDQEQIIVVQYLEAHGYKFTAIPNHTYNPHRSQQAKNHRLGLRKGLCDLMVIVSGSLLFIEMKRTKGSVTSPEQHAWIDALNEVPNVQAFICRGAQAAIDVIDAATIIKPNKDQLYYEPPF